ncbi:MAG: hypothetical protein JST26_06860 [Bacteroidetes bacterium]|nr:hypothetical protein [Bacteroidota bacterium]
MELTRSEKNRHQTISGGIALALLTALLLALLYYSLDASRNRLPAETKEAGMPQLLAISSEGTDEGLASGAQTSSKQTPAGNPQTTNEASPVVVTEKSDAEKLIDQFKQHKTQSGSKPAGDGTPENEGITPGGSTKGDPETISPQMQFSLSGRTILEVPALSQDAREAGAVVVEIEVDKYGNVTMASPNGRGTTTTSAILREKARQAALTTKFSESKTMETQRGRITFLFSYK